MAEEKKTYSLEELKKIASQLKTAKLQLSAKKIAIKEKLDSLTASLHEMGYDTVEDAEEAFIGMTLDFEEKTKVFSELLKHVNDVMAVSVSKEDIINELMGKINERRKERLESKNQIESKATSENVDQQGNINGNSVAGSKEENNSADVITPSEEQPKVKPSIQIQVKPKQQKEVGEFEELKSSGGDVQEVNTEFLDTSLFNSSTAESISDKKENEFDFEDLTQLL